MIDEGLSPDQATARFYALGSKGLLTSDYPGTLRDFQVPYARTAAEVAAWPRDPDGRIGLAEVVTRSRATMLIGTSTQPGAFTEQIVTDDGLARRTAHHHAPVQPDLALRGPGRRPDRVDRRAGAHRDRQPLRAGPLRRGRVPGRPGQQRAHLPRPRPRRHRQPGPPRQRRHARRRGRRAGWPGRRHRPGRGRAAPGHQPAGGVRRGRRGCRPGGPGRGAVRRAPRRPGRTGPRGHVGARPTRRWRPSDDAVVRARGAAA